jgi:DNA polymerase III epsilon subunit-like protein
MKIVKNAVFKGWETVLITILAIFIFAIIILIIKDKIVGPSSDLFSKDRQSDLINKINNIIDRHIEVLANKKASYTSIDDYGHVQINEKKWDKEVLYFMQNVVMKELTANKGAVTFEFNATELIEEKLRKHSIAKMLIDSETTLAAAIKNKPCDEYQEGSSNLSNSSLSDHTGGILSKRLDEVKYAIFDFETTGMSFGKGDKVVELAFVKYSYTNGIIEEFSTLVNPGRNIPPEASDVHGIYDQDVYGLPFFDNYVHNILKIISDTVLVGHNVYFDLRFLHGEMSAFGFNFNSPHVCTMGFPGFFGGQTGLKLSRICQEYGISSINSHNALADVRATTKLLEKFIDTAFGKGIYTFQDLKCIKNTSKFVSSWSYTTPSFLGKFETKFALGASVNRSLKI